MSRCDSGVVAKVTVVTTGSQCIKINGYSTRARGNKSDHSVHLSVLCHLSALKSPDSKLQASWWSVQSYSRKWRKPVFSLLMLNHMIMSGYTSQTYLASKHDHILIQLQMLKLNVGKGCPVIVGMSDVPIATALSGVF